MGMSPSVHDCRHNLIHTQVLHCCASSKGEARRELYSERPAIRQAQGFLSRYEQCTSRVYTGRRTQEFLLSQGALERWVDSNQRLPRGWSWEFSASKLAHCSVSLCRQVGKAGFWLRKFLQMHVLQIGESIWMFFFSTGVALSVRKTETSQDGAQ